MTGLEIAAYLLAAALALVICRVFWRPLKSVLVMVANSLLGGLGLYIFNLAFSGTGFSIGINIVTAAVCGLFGLPGLVLLILLKFLFGM
ncbi:MAG: pro-sigmaK processing inhibitor BofA [Ruminococcaceae bacterium]|nr:pro-sigmaK processing inhibitor BofA [Oscillospiraceae bacterium]